MELAHLDSSKTDGPAAAGRFKRYRLVSRLEAQGTRVRRFSLAQADGLPRLERLEPAARTVRPAR
jgi:hypothetical protein